MSPSESDQKPPLPAWPPEVFDHEPAHGFFQRLARVNGHFSTRALATSMGLNGRNINHAELLEFCLRFPVLGHEKLVSATPVIAGQLVTISGETFSTSFDWFISKPRVCPGCIGESPYYRNWFDLTVIGRCPLHDLPLEPGVNGDALRWWHPEVGMTPNGFKLAQFNARRVQPLPESWERYVLGRLGVVEPLDLPMLDRTRMNDVITVAKSMGRTLPFGWRPIGATSNGRSRAARRDEIIRGYELLRGGPDAIASALQNYLHSRAAPFGSLGNRNGAPSWGWLEKHKAMLPQCELSDMLHEQMRRAELSYGQFKAYAEPARGRERVEQNELGAKARSAMALYRCAREMNMSADKLRSILIGVGMIKYSNNRKKRHSLSLGEVRRVVEEAAELLTVTQATEFLGTSHRNFMKFVKSGNLVPFVKVGVGQVAHNRYRRADLLELRRNFVTHGRKRGTPIVASKSASQGRGSTDLGGDRGQDDA